LVGASGESEKTRRRATKLGGEVGELHEVANELRCRKGRDVMAQIGVGWEGYSIGGGV